MGAIPALPVTVAIFGDFNRVEGLVLIGHDRTRRQCHVSDRVRRPLPPLAIGERRPELGRDEPADFPQSVGVVFSNVHDTMQATVAVEIEQQLGGCPDHVVLPVGGGGLSSGGLEYFGSTFIGMLIRLAKKARADSGEAVLCCLSETMREMMKNMMLLENTKTDFFWTPYESKDAALTALKNGETSAT